MQIKQDPEIKRTVCYENNSIKANCSFFYASNESKSVLARAKVYCFIEMRAVDFLSISCACKRNVLMET